MSFRVSVGTDEGPKKGLVYLMSSLGLVDVVSRCVMMIFGDSITNVSMMKSCSPFSKKPIPELDGNMLRKKKSPQTKKRLLKQQMSPDSGRNWVCLFCRADSVRFPRSDAVGSPSPGTVFAWEIPDPNGEKNENHPIYGGL